MKETILIFANCAGIIASIFGFGITVIHLWKGVPPNPQRRKNQAKTAIIASIIFTILLLFLSYRLHRVIGIYEQTGSFRQYRQAELQIYYTIPYKYPPKLEFEKKIKSEGFTSGPKILEQRPNSFKVELDLDSWLYDWKATGIRIPND